MTSHPSTNEHWSSQSLDSGTLLEDNIRNKVFQIMNHLERVLTDKCVMFITFLYIPDTFS